MSPHWKIVYDATQAAVYPRRIGMLTMAAAAATVYAAILWFGTRGHRKPGLRGMHPTIAVWVACALSFGLALTVGTKWWGFRRLHADFRAGRCRSVSGQVRVLSGETGTGPSARELLEVGGVRFQLSGDGMRAGYDEKAKDGSPLLNGVRARLLYCPEGGRNVIAKVEVSKDSPPHGFDEPGTDPRWGSALPKVPGGRRPPPRPAP